MTQTASARAGQWSAYRWHQHQPHQQRSAHSQLL